MKEFNYFEFYISIFIRLTKIVIINWQIRSCYSCAAAAINLGLMLMRHTYRLRIARRLSLANSLIDRMPNVSSKQSRNELLVLTSHFVRTSRITSWSNVVVPRILSIRNEGADKDSHDRRSQNFCQLLESSVK